MNNNIITNLYIKKTINENITFDFLNNNILKDKNCISDITKYLSDKIPNKKSDFMISKYLYNNSLENNKNKLNKKLHLPFLIFLKNNFITLDISDKNILNNNHNYKIDNNLEYISFSNCKYIHLIYKENNIIKELLFSPITNKKNEKEYFFFNVYYGKIDYIRIVNLIHNKPLWNILFHLNNKIKKHINENIYYDDKNNKNFIYSRNIKNKPIQIVNGYIKKNGTKVEKYLRGKRKDFPKYVFNLTNFTSITKEEYLKLTKI